MRRSREDLRARIEVRVEGMFETGLLEETQRLLEEGLEYTSTAAHAIGYAEAAGYLKGESSLAAAVEETKKRTWRYVKRQMTWFRGDDRIVWVEIRGDEPVAEVSGRVMEIIENRKRNH